MMAIGDMFLGHDGNGDVFLVFSSKFFTDRLTIPDLPRSYLTTL